MSKKQNPLKSVRVKLFMTLSLVILLIIIFYLLKNLIFTLRDLTCLSLGYV